MNEQTKRFEKMGNRSKKVFALLAATTLLSAVTPLAQAQNEPTPGASEPHKYTWELERTDGPCKSYSSVVAGKEYLAAKAVCDVPARIEVIGTILHDIEGFPAWMADCEATKVLKVESEDKDTIVFWLHQHIPILKDKVWELFKKSKLNPI